MNRFSSGALLGALLAAGTVVAEEDDEHHDIEEIVVTAMPLGRTVESLTQSTSVLAGDALTRSQDASIGEVVANELGVSATYFGPVSSRPVIRGQYGERVLVLNNGLDSLDASALSEDHAVGVDSLLADSVEIIRGPATLIYGSNASGGIVNIVDSRIRESAPDAALSGGATYSTDSALGSDSSAFRIAAGNERLVAHVDYMHRNTDDVEIPGFAESARLRMLEGELDAEPEGSIDNSDSSTDNVGLALSWLGDDGDFFGVSFSDYSSNYGIPGGHAHGDAEEEEDIRIDLDQQRIELRGQAGLRGAFEALRVQAVSSDYRHIELEGEEPGTIYRSDGTELRVDLMQKATDRLAGTIGLQYKQVDLDAIGEEAFVPASKTSQFGLYAFQEWTASERIIVQGSARLERQRIEAAGFDEYSASSAGFAIGSIFAINDALSLSTNIALTERHPNATELYAFGPHVAVERFERGAVALGQAAFDNETSTNIDVTLRGQADRISWAVTAFNNDISDYILLSPTADFEDGLQVFDYRQSDATLYGVEAELLVDLIRASDRHLHARLFSDFVHAEEDSGEYLPRITPSRYGTSLHYTQRGFDASLSVARHDGQARVASYELATDGYTMLDAKLSYRFEGPKLMVFLQGLNLGDEDARRHTSPLKDVAPLPGRSLRLGLRWDF